MMKGIEHFGLGLPDLEKIIQTALESGAGWCDLYFEDTVYQDILLRDSCVAAGGFNIDYGCGIRVLSGERTGYAYAETTDLPSLLKAAKAASAIALGSKATDQSKVPGPVTQLSPQPAATYPQTRDWATCSNVAKESAALEEIEKKIRQKDPRCSKVIATLAWSESRIVMYNSLGELTSDYRPLASISVSAVFQNPKNGQMENTQASSSYRKGVEMITPELIEDLASRAVRDVDNLFEARRPKGGKMPVVMGAGASGILLHEAIGHAFEADFNRKGQSVFSDRMGKRICPKGINIVDDGTIVANRGACTYDDEGAPGQKTYMVSDGILTSYLHDRISAAWYGVAPTGNGRRESFRYNPIPRMRATYMENGTSSTDAASLIAEVKKGIYVDQFANGQVKIGEGDFTFYVKSGYLIENGRLTSPVKDINIIGNGPDALADIRGVAGDLVIDNSTWTCGKEQSVAVSCGMPSVLIGKLTVGGN